MIEVIGWLGSALLCMCGLPQVYTTFKKKTVEGLSLGMLVAWHFGGILSLVYVWNRGGQGPLLSNYGLNSLVTTSLLVMYFKYRAR